MLICIGDGIRDSLIQILTNFNVCFSILFARHVVAFWRFSRGHYRFRSSAVDTCAPAKTAATRSEGQDG